MARAPRTLTDFEQGYIDCALWLILDSAENGESRREDWSEDNIHASAWREMLQDCKDFADANRAELDIANAEGRDDTHLGHDFFLSRNGHGTGFWDRGLSNGDALHAAAKVYGSQSLMEGPRALYVCNG